MTNMLLTYGDNISIAKSAGDILFNLWFQFWTFRIILLVRNSCNVVSGGRDFFLKSFSKAILGDWIWGRGERVFLPFIFSVSIFFSVVSAFCQAEICNFQWRQWKVPQVSMQFPSNWGNGKYPRWATTLAGRTCLSSFPCQTQKVPTLK